MGDIVERLEKNCPCSSDIGCADALCREAAAEITRLRTENERLRAENKVLSKTGDDLVMLLNAVSREIIKRRDEILSHTSAALKEPR